MKKSELTTGMVVTLRSGEKYMVFKKVDSVYTSHTVGGFCDCLIHLNRKGVWNSLSYYDENLYYEGDLGSSEDVMKVEIIKHPCDFQTFFKENQHYLTLLWERKEVKEVTMAEIEEKFGCKIKIIKDVTSPN